MAEEEFVDYSFASPWERFSGSVEQVLREWGSAEGSKGTQEVATRVEIKHKLPFRREPYELSLYVPETISELTERDDENRDAGKEDLGKDEKDVEMEGASEGSESELAEESDSDEMLPENSPDDRGTSSGDEQVTTQRAIIKRASVRTSEFCGRVFFRPAGHFDDSLHKIQRWFGITRFALLRPGSYSGRILDAQEASTIVSAASLALSNLTQSLPVFVPVHDNFRDGYWGVAVVDGRTVHFDTDSSQVSKRPELLRGIEGQLSVLAEQLAGYSPQASRTCASIARSMQGLAEEDVGGDRYRVTVSACVSYKIPLPLMGKSATGKATVGSSDLDESDAAAFWRDTWDDGCVWQPWAAEFDPIGALEIDLIWKDAEFRVGSPPPKLMASNANVWRVHALSAERNSYVSWSIFSSKKRFQREHLKLPKIEDVTREGYGSEDDEFWGLGEYADNPRSLAWRLRELMDAWTVARHARAVGDMSNQEWWEMQDARAPVVPPNDVLLQSVNDLFGDDDVDPAFMTEHVQYEDSENAVQKSGRGLKLVPFYSLIWRLALHAVVYRNARAVSLLWCHVVHNLRVNHWEPLKSLPLMQPGNAGQPTADEREGDSNVEPDAPDLNTCLLHQKVQLLNICIHRQRVRLQEGVQSPAIGRMCATVDPFRKSRSVSLSSQCETDYESCTDDPTPESSPMKIRRKSSTDWPLSNEGASANQDTPAGTGNQPKGQGMASVLEGAFLVNQPDTPIHIPITQPVPVYTVDTLAEHQTTLSVLEESAEGHERASRMQAQVLVSDMAAFKAANPDAILDDFVRWHSPKDWVREGEGSGKLSERMSKWNNRWQVLWNEVEPRAASQQPPLMDPLVEGERAMHYLETIPPGDLFKQLSLVGFVAALSCLQKAPTTKFDIVKRKVEELKDLVQSRLPSTDSGMGWIDEMDDLLRSFEVVERVVVLSESLSRRLPNCPDVVEDLLGAILERGARGVEVSEKERLHVSQSMAGGGRPEKEEDSESSRGPTWGTALQHEWVVACENVQTGLSHRLYVKDGADEVRIGTVVIADS